jgi:hypothetical protein
MRRGEVVEEETNRWEAIGKILGAKHIEKEHTICFC